MSLDLNDNELNGPPRFEMGEKVVLRKMIRNDGTFPGVDIGETLARKGEVGYVAHIGTFLGAFYIYAVSLSQTGRLVGCKANELESLEETVP